MKKVDMSSEAISKRLRLASDLRDLALSLKRSKPLTPEQAREMIEARKNERSNIPTK